MCHNRAGYLVQPITKQKLCGSCYSYITMNIRTVSCPKKTIKTTTTTLPVAHLNTPQNVTKEKICCFHCGEISEMSEMIGFCPKCCEEKNKFLQSPNNTKKCFQCGKKHESMHIMCETCKLAYYAAYSKQLEEYMDSLPQNQSFYL